MEHETEITINKNILPASIIAAGVIIAGALLYQVDVKVNNEQVISAEGVELPATWGDLGAKLGETGVIDSRRFKALYQSRGEFTKEGEEMLMGESRGKIRITKKNAGYLLNLLWALGLGNKNSILEEGPMADEKYGGAQNFASTAGWTLAVDNTMDHYSQHEFMALTPEQQKLAEKVAKGIYRPCCSNSAYFPDCNHGMAMLGFIELMASQGVGEEEMRRAAHIVNSYWFPEFYEKNNNSNSSCAVS